MATLAEIEEVLGVLAFVFTDNDEPSRAKFRTAFASPEGKQTLPDRVIILHCTSDYPAKVDEINLRAIDTLAETLGLRVGFPIIADGIAIPVCGDGARCG